MNQTSPSLVPPTSVAASGTSQPRVRIGRRSTDGKKPEITLQKNGNRVETIVVRCGCGQEISIDCRYDESN